MKKILIFVKIAAVIALFGGGGAALSACNTVEGMGEDVSAAGRGITHGARSVERKITD